MYFYPACDSEWDDVPNLQGIKPITIGLIALAIIWGGIGNTFIAYFPGVDFLIESAKMSYVSLFVK